MDFLCATQNAETGSEEKLDENTKIIYLLFSRLKTGLRHVVMATR